MLKSIKGKWIKKLSRVLWAIRISSMRVTSETPFSLVYGTEAVIPIEIITQTKYTIIENFDNNFERSQDLVLSKELCDKSRIWMDDQTQKWKLTSINLSGSKSFRLDNRFYGGYSRTKRSGWLGNYDPIRKDHIKSSKLHKPELTL